MKKIVKRILRKIFLSIYEQPQKKDRLPKFESEGENVQIEPPYSISNPGKISVGNNIGFGPGSVLKAQTEYPRGWMQHPRGEHIRQQFDSRIRIGNGVTATASLQVVAFHEIVIEDDVMFATNVFVCDGLHASDRADIPYKYQGISRIAPIYIRKGCWIGQNVVILPDVEIGEFSIVGANSVVTKSIPPRSIAVGTPARIIKRWNQGTEKWETLQ